MLSLDKSSFPVEAGLDSDFWKQKLSRLKAFNIKYESEKDQYRSLVISLEEEVARQRGARLELQERDKIISSYKEFLSSQCQKIDGESQRIVMDFLAQKKLPMDGSL